MQGPADHHLITVAGDGQGRRLVRREWRRPSRSGSNLGAPEPRSPRLGVDEHAAVVFMESRPA